ncbi:MAG: potassium channel family protein [Bacteroidales bacterium]|nr:potassium channel family protein [Bacteroidales bacterium]
MIYLWRAIIAFFRDERYRILIISVLSFLFAGTIVFHFVEKWRLLDSLYFSVITLTTVGYGDLSPQTDFGKVFTMLYVFSGIGIIFGFINAFTKHRDETAVKLHKRRRERVEKIKDKRRKKPFDHFDTSTSSTQTGSGRASSGA